MKRERIGRITAELSALVHEVVGEHMDTVENHFFFKKLPADMCKPRNQSLFLNIQIT